MKLIIRKSDNVVAYQFDESAMVELRKNKLVTDSFRAFDVNSTTHEIVRGVARNTGFKGGQFIHDGAWKDLEGNPAKRTIMTRLEFVRLFTHDEYKAIEASTMPDAINYFQEVKYGTGKVDLSAELEMDGLAFLVANNLLTQERSDEISEGVPV